MVQKTWNFESMRRIQLLFQTIPLIERSSIIQLDELLWNTALCNMHALRGVNTICIASLKLHFSALSHQDYLKFVIYNPIAFLQTGEFPKVVKNDILEKNPLLSFNHTERSPINMILILISPTIWTNEIILFFWNIPSFFTSFSTSFFAFIIRATIERQTKMSQITPILGHINLGYVAPGIEKSAQGRMWWRLMKTCLMNSSGIQSEMSDQWWVRLSNAS